MGKVPLAGAIRVCYRDAVVEDAILPLAPASNPAHTVEERVPPHARAPVEGMALMQTGSDAAQQRAQREAAGATVDEGRWIYLSAIMHCTQAHLAQSGPAAIPRQRPELSERQRDVLEGLAQGQRQKQIAYNLQISENTVAYHVAQLRRRLECSHSNEIVAAAYLAGLLTPR